MLKATYVKASSLFRLAGRRAHTVRYTAKTRHKKANRKAHKMETMATKNDKDTIREVRDMRGPKIGAPAMVMRF